ncbi:MAG: hypothetical protein OZ924_10650 [Burkholderiaceae bacterium]|nr:hypothetical protein [Burkholderiaceae bacterium]
MAVIFRDLFEEAAVTPLANHTPDLGIGWTPLYNSAATTVIQVKPLGQSGVSNLCGPSTSENNVTALYAINPSPSTADVKLEAARYMLNWQVSNSYSAGLFARVIYTTDWSGYFVQMVPNLNSGASIRLYKKVLGVTTLLASYDHDFVSGDIVTFECYDAAKRVLVNGVERINHADNTVTGIGYAGLYWGNFVISGHMRAEMEFGYLTVTDASVVGQTIDLAAGSAGGAAAAAGLDVTRDLQAAAAGRAVTSGRLDVEAILPNLIASADAGYDAVSARLYGPGTVTKLMQATPYGDTVWKIDLTGSCSLELGSDPDDATYYSDRSLPVTPGQPYTVTVWLRITSTSATGTGIGYLFWWAADAGSYFAIDLASLPVGTWFRFTSAGTPTDPFVITEINANLNATSTVEIAGLMLTAGDKLPLIYTYGTRDVAAVSAGEATVSAELNIGAEVLLAAQTEGSTSLAAVLAVEKALAGQPAGVAAVLSDLVADWTLVAQIAGTGTAIAELETLGQVTLATSIAGEALLDVDLVATYSLAVQSDGTSTVSATSPALTREIAASVTGTSEVAAGLVAMRDLAVVADGGALVDADLTVLTLVYADLTGQIAGGSSLSALLAVLHLGAVGDVRTWIEPVTGVAMSGAVVTRGAARSELVTEVASIGEMATDVRMLGRRVTIAAGDVESLR